MNKEQKDKIGDILKESNSISNSLSQVLEKECEKRGGLNPHMAIFSVASFVADFLEDIKPMFDYNIEDIFFSTVKDMMSSENESKTDMAR